MESELKPKRIPRIVKPKKAEGEYETKIYVRRAVKAYEERMMNDFPEKYELRLQKQRDRYAERKKIKQLTKMLTEPENK